MIHGKKQKISVLDREYDGQYVFWISVDDMADIFGFDYDIDEDNNVIDLSF